MVANKFGERLRNADIEILESNKLNGDFSVTLRHSIKVNGEKYKTVEYSNDHYSTGTAHSLNVSRTESILKTLRISIYKFEQSKPKLHYHEFEKNY